MHVLTQSLHDETFVSTALILNADRDFYQAANAELNTCQQPAFPKKRKTVCWLIIRKMSSRPKSAYGSNG
jgi:hypothetical protein